MSDALPLVDPSGPLLGGLVVIIIELLKQKFPKIGPAHIPIVRAALVLTVCAGGPLLAFLKGPESFALLNQHAAQVALTQAAEVFVGAVAAFLSMGGLRKARHKRKAKKAKEVIKL